VRSGGHSSAGHSTTQGGIVLDLSAMKGLEIDPVGRTAWAETGLTAGEYTTATGAHGLATGFGDTASVGIGGITLGGGIGFLVRKHGLTIDSLLAAELVTADGRLLHTDAETHPDLFWAIRGGGGNFGVAIRLRFRLHPVGTVVGGMLLLPATPEVIAGFVAEAEAAQPVLDRFRALATPIADMLQPMPYSGMFPPEEDDDHPTAVAHTMFVDRVDHHVASTILQHLEASDAAMRVAELRVLGGAMARVPVVATAFAHRHSRIMVNLAAFYDGPADRPCARPGSTGSRPPWPKATAVPTSTSWARRAPTGCGPPTRAGPGTAWSPSSAARPRQPVPPQPEHPARSLQDRLRITAGHRAGHGGVRGPRRGQATPG
jgi:FAD/FMN-containing dehydrogenase